MNATTINTNRTYAAPRKKFDFAELLDNIAITCVFLPLVTTLAWIIYAIPGLPIWIADFVLAPMMIVGWVATLISCPLKLLKLLGKMVGKPFLLGLRFPIIPANFLIAMFLLAGGLTVFAGLLIFAPALVTIVNFFKGE